MFYFLLGYAPVQLLVCSVPLFDMQSGCYRFALALLRASTHQMVVDDSSGFTPPEVVRLNEYPPGRRPDFGITNPFSSASNRVMRPG
jgi:hypothetical protein